MRPSVKRWLREPLLQFLVAGVLLFAGYRMLHPEASRTTEDNRIELTADHLRQLEIDRVTQRARPVATYAIGTLAGFWFVERVAGFV